LGSLTFGGALSATALGFARLRIAARCGSWRSWRDDLRLRHLHADLLRRAMHFNPLHLEQVQQSSLLAGMSIVSGKHPCSRAFGASLGNSTLALQLKSCQERLASMRDIVHAVQTRAP